MNPRGFLRFRGRCMDSHSSAVRLRMDGVAVWEVFLEPYIYCALKGVNCMQKWVVSLVNGISELENILELGS
jgi:hypothetical protein